MSAPAAIAGAALMNARARRRTARSLELLDVAAHAIDRAGIPLQLQRLVQPLRRAPLAHRQMLLRLQPRLQLLKVRSQLRLRLPTPPVLERRPSAFSARLTVLRESLRSRAIALIDSPCTSRRRRIFPIVSTHSTPVTPA